jgi:hypothetical protein
MAVVAVIAVVVTVQRTFSGLMSVGFFPTLSTANCSRSSVMRG